MHPTKDTAYPVTSKSDAAAKRRVKVGSVDSVSRTIVVALDGRMPTVRAGDLTQVTTADRALGYIFLFVLFWLIAAIRQFPHFKSLADNCML